MLQQCFSITVIKIPKWFRLFVSILWLHVVSFYSIQTIDESIQLVVSTGKFHGISRKFNDIRQRGNHTITPVGDFSLLGFHGMFILNKQTPVLTIYVNNIALVAIIAIFLSKSGTFLAVVCLSSADDINFHLVYNVAKREFL